MCIRDSYLHTTDLSGSGGPDSEHHLSGLLVESFQSNPVHIEGILNRAGKLTNSRLYSNAIGLLVDSGDWEINTVDVGGTDVGAGIMCFGGNIKWVNAKSWFSKGHGWHIDSPRNSFVGCEAQDNTLHGFYVEDDCLLVGCQADSNGFNGTNTPTPSHDGFHLTATASGTVMQGCRSFDKNEAGRGFHQRFGVYVDGGASPLMIDTVTRDNASGSTGGDLTPSADRVFRVIGS